MPENRQTDKGSPDLEFPIRTELPPEEIPATVDMILAASEEFLAVWNEDAASEKRRGARRCHVPFMLDPE